MLGCDDLALTGDTIHAHRGEIGGAMSGQRDGLINALRNQSSAHVLSVCSGVVPGVILLL
jgi:hypothetical protein